MKIEISERELEILSGYKEYAIIPEHLREICNRFSRTNKDLIGAIVAYRRATNTGLKEAKDQVEKWRDE